MGLLLIATWLVPLTAAALAPSRRFWWLPALAPLPALATAALVPPDARIEIPWLLFGSVLGMDGTDRIFLAFTSILWLAAGLYAAGSMRAAPHAGRFRIFFLLAMAGNLWLIVGQDLASFYAGFSLMGLASYALVIHEGDRAALRAGKVYLVMTLLGELALFVALVLIADHIGGVVPDAAALVGLGDLAIGLLLAGLAIKAGLVPVHVWLPLAHPAAPVPASAVLSGTMIKVALLGWLRFLPIGDAALTEWGLLLVFTGFSTLFYALPIGLVQANPKVILAYSSVSKMGLMALTLGLIMLEPDLAPAGVSALALYAAHHALVKGGLFLGVGLRHHARAQAPVMAGTLVLALSLAELPFTGGAVAKYGIKPTLAGAGWSWLLTAVTLSTAATALLMARFLWVIWRTEPHPSPGQLLGATGWGGLIAASLLFSLVLGAPPAWSTNALPIAAAAVLALPFALAAWREPSLLRPAVGLVRPGDLLGLVRPPLAVLAFTLRYIGHGWSRLLRAGAAALQASVATLRPADADPERALRSWPNAGAAWLLITALLLGLARWSLPDLQVLDRPEVAALPPAEEASRPEQAAGPIRAVPEESLAGEQVPEGSAAPDPAPVPAVRAARSQRPPPAPRTRPETPEPPGPAVPEVPAAAAGKGSIDAAGPPAPETAPTTAVDAALSEADADAPERCDPDQPFVFSHPQVAEPLQLEGCVQGTEGPIRLVAPPLTNELVALVQRHLQDLGYEPGPLDGLIGPRTRGAIRRFQRDLGSEPTGTLSFALLGQIRSAAADAASE